MVYAQSCTTESLRLIDKSLCKWPYCELQPHHTINVNEGMYWTYTCNRQTAGNGTLLPQISQQHNHRPLASDQPHSSPSSPVPPCNELGVGADQEKDVNDQSSKFVDITQSIKSSKQQHYFKLQWSSMKLRVLKTIDLKCNPCCFWITKIDLITLTALQTWSFWMPAKMITVNQH